ncbi:beta-class carbonic anhydrase [Candidatus Solirubrobacter pratensis]|uniref:beta-class carbonic anhydrase n=1 Tax=Candidatus Solirubrobacter pratensis TaxID=1298857 RepID=UPI0003F80C91|nr:carbonic anhydrase [Candidatus Solirubrobacter pratensis]
MSVIDDLLANNEVYAASFAQQRLPVAPAKKVAVLACMDSRLDVFGALGLGNGEAHVIRNAGGVVTEDAVRSLAISQRMMGTEAIVLIHHTECGMHGLDDDAFKRSLESETGVRPRWPDDSFSDLDEDVRRSIERIKASPFIPRTDDVRGFVYDIGTGRLREVA